MHMKEFGFGGSMKLSVIAREVILGCLLPFVSLSVLGQGLPPGVTPGMVDQLKSMSPAQQQALARQYGITLPAGRCSSADVPVLAAPGAMLPTPMGMTQDDIEAATPDKTEEVEIEPAPATDELTFQSRRVDLRTNRRRARSRVLPFGRGRSACGSALW